jgi:hypothetical protein
MYLSISSIQFSSAVTHSFRIAVRWKAEDQRIGIMAIPLYKTDNRVMPACDGRVRCYGTCSFAAFSALVGPSSGKGVATYDPTSSSLHLRADNG